MGHSLFAELKRRNVFKAGVAYLALGWVVTQVTSTVTPLMHLPDWMGSVVLWIGVIGFPFVIMFSWVYELTPEGLKRESEVDRSASITHVTSRRLDYIIIGLLVLAIGLFVLDPFGSRRSTSTTSSEATEPAAAPAATPAAPPISDNSIAVLPFVNMSSDKEQEYFSDGITEELLNLLAKIPGLQVTARTSSFSFKGKEIGIPEIAKTLHVANILEGSVRKSGNQVRITAQLINALNDKHLWSETYDRTLDDIFKAQDDIAAAVVAQLKIKLLGAAPTAKPVDARAYPLILRAKALADQHTTTSNQEATALYRQALDIVPDEARAWDGLAELYIAEESAGELSVAEASRLAREAVNKALAVDQDATTYSLLGQIAVTYDSDFSAAANHFQKALDLEPRNPDILFKVARFLQTLGRFDDAIAVGRYIVGTLDPASSHGHYDLGVSLYLARRWDEAIASFRTALTLSPQRSTAHFLIGDTLLQKGDAQGALAEMQAETAEFWRMVGLPLANHALGRNAESDAGLARLIAKYEQDGPFNIAYVYAFRGEADHAFEWLDKAVAYRDSGLNQVAGEPLFTKVRDDPRWLPFLRKIGYAPEQLAKIDFKVTLPAEWQAKATADTATTPVAATH